jgi:hypothetical protein
VTVASTFWDWFFLLLIWLPLVLLWIFSLIDIFRREDLTGPQKALWVAIVIIVPFLGTIIYLFKRATIVTHADEAAVERASREFAEPPAADDRTSRLATIADLHDRGKLTDAEFAAEKARILGASQS